MTCKKCDMCWHINNPNYNLTKRRTHFLKYLFSKTFLGQENKKSPQKSFQRMRSKFEKMISNFWLSVTIMRGDPGVAETSSYQIKSIVIATRTHYSEQSYLAILQKFTKKAKKKNLYIWYCWDLNCWPSK